MADPSEARRVVTGSSRYDRYWSEGEADTLSRQARDEDAYRAGRVRLPAWVDEHNPRERRHLLDWLSHLAALPVEPSILAWHLCPEARLDVLQALGRIVYDAVLPGWTIGEFAYAPDDVDHEGYPGMCHDGLGPIHFCPYCGTRLDPIEDDDAGAEGIG